MPWLALVLQYVSDTTQLAHDVVSSLMLILIV
jgi:hypothetical protein